MVDILESLTFKNFHKGLPESKIQEFWSFINKNVNNFHKLSYDEIELNIGDVLQSFYNYTLRMEFIYKYSWSIPCKEAIDMILKYTSGPLYDLLGGTGFWAKTIRNAGRSVIFYDLHKGKYNPYKHVKTHIPVTRRNALRAAYKFNQLNKPVNVILSWVPYDSTIGEHILNMIPIGSIVIWIGEGQGGCCGTHKTFDIFNNQFKELDSMYLNQWVGLHDSITIYKKIS